MANATSNTHQYSEKIIGLAKIFMHLYLKEEGTKSVNHFNAEILGLGIFDSNIETAWAQTVFCWALKFLVEEGRVTTCRDEQGIYWYTAAG